jgi:hypothetical protein
MRAAARGSGGREGGNCSWPSGFGPASLRRRGAGPPKRAFGYLRSAPGPDASAVLGRRALPAAGWLGARPSLPGLACPEPPFHSMQKGPQAARVGGYVAPLKHFGVRIGLSQRRNRCAPYSLRLSQPMMEKRRAVWEGYRGRFPRGERRYDGTRVATC